jgi:hypothetical protein
MNAANRSAGANLLSALSERLTGSLHGRRWGLAGGAMMIAAALAACLFAWRKWGHLVTERSEFRLAAESIDVTPQPPWIRTDVTADVFRDGALSRLTALDREVTGKVARAFALHPWVANVTRVSKHHPRRILVQLEYRRPVAMVEVPFHDRGGLFPVDPQGVLLPPTDFDEQQARDYLRVSAGDTWPAGPVGTPWGDQRVTGAAQIADAIGPAWKELALYRIVIREEGGVGRRAADPLYELRTRRDTRITWGSAPGREGAGEPSAQDKVARLISFVQTNGTLDHSSAALDLDLRSQRLANPRTARRAGGSS